MQTISDEDSFKACWIKTILYHLLTKKEILDVANYFRLIDGNDEKLSKAKLIKIILGSQKDDLIRELEGVLARRGISPHLYNHLKDLYTKIETLEPNKLANIYLHITEDKGVGDMARQVFNGKDLKKIFSDEIITKIFYEVLAKAENKSLMMFEHIINRNTTLDR